MPALSFRSARLLSAFLLGAVGPGFSAPVKPVKAPAPPSASAPALPTASSPSISSRPPGPALPLRQVEQKALRVPEHLLFDVIWGGWNFRWVHAGQATLELLPSAKPEEWQIRSLAWCNKFFQTFYPVRDTVTSLIDARGIYPLRFDKRLKEGSYRSRTLAVFDQKANKMTLGDTIIDIEPFTHDILSAFYYIRTQQLEPGKTLELAAVSGRKKYNLRVLCHGREKVSVKAGTFKTLVVEPVLKGDGLFKAKGKLTIWLTDDEYRIPVKMQSRIPVGSIKAELVTLKTPPSPALP